MICTYLDDDWSMELLLAGVLEEDASEELELCCVGPELELRLLDEELELEAMDEDRGV